MAKKPKKSKKQEQHPTIFVFDGGIKHFADGSMLELHTQVKDTEWAMIIEETLKYKIFLECLKDVAIPLLDDQWTEEDDWFRLQLGVATSRIRNIDPLAFIKFNEEQIKDAYSEAMKNSAPEVRKFVEEFRESQKDILLKKYNITSVSDL